MKKWAKDVDLLCREELEKIYRDYYGETLHNKKLHNISDLELRNVVRYIVKESITKQRKEEEIRTKMFKEKMKQELRESGKYFIETALGSLVIFDVVEKDKDKDYYYNDYNQLCIINDCGEEEIVEY